MRISSGEDIRVTASLPLLDSLAVASDQATEEAVIHLMADLRTPLLEDTYSDLWMTREFERASNELRFKTKAGFIQDGFVAGTGLTREAAEADTSLTDALIVDQEKGTVFITDVTISKFVSIRYTAGYPLIVGDDDERLDLTGAPAFLKAMADAKALELLAQTPDLNNEKGDILDGKAFARRYAVMLEGHVRYLPSHRSPLV